MGSPLEGRIKNDGAMGRGEEDGIFVLSHALVILPLTERGRGGDDGLF